MEGSLEGSAAPLHPQVGLVEGAASAPTHPDIELEPPQWQPRAMWVSTRNLCGAASFFFASFVFAYFYLRSLDTNGDWKIGHVSAPIGWGIVVLVLLVASAVALRAGVQRPALMVSAGGAAVVLALASIAAQCIEWTTLGFGPASGGYASVFVGWTIFYAVFTLPCVYWIEILTATAWRRRRHGVGATTAQVTADEATIAANRDACSFFWNFYVFNGLVLFVILYLL